MAQSAGGQNNTAVQDQEKAAARQELMSFDQFLNSHPKIADQIHRDPSLVNNDVFVKHHPALENYLDDHPGVRKEIKKDEGAFASLEMLHARSVDGGMRGSGRDFDRVQERDQDQGPTRQQLAEFEQFLDNHNNIAADLKQKPWLATNHEYLQAHPGLNNFLNDHPELREQVGRNPSVFVTQDERFDNSTYRRDLAEFDRFLDKHPDVDRQLRENPWLVSNYDYSQSHPDLRTFVQQHPELQTQINKNPEAVISDVEVYDRDTGRDRGAVARNDRDLDRDRERDRDRDRDHGVNRDRDIDTTRRELASFDRFLDSHREIAEQIRKNPSLVNDSEFVKNHPALQTYLKDHSAVREEVKENPSSFMQQEARYEHTEDNGVRYHRRDADRDRDDLHRQFGEFLGGHSDIAKQLSKDPSLVKNEEFMANHQDLKDYLKSHPDVQQELMKNPQNFVSVSQKFRTGTNGDGTAASGSGTTTKPPATSTTPTTEPKPKQ